MNVLIIVVASVSAGWLAQKMYRVCSACKKSKKEKDADQQEVKENKTLAKKSPVSDDSTKATVKSNVEETAVVSNTANAAKEKTSKKKEAKKQVKKTKKAPDKAEPTQLNDDHVDDLSQLKGVGPKLSEALEEIGIQNYEQLYEPSMDLLLARLRETGGRFTRPALTAIVERARLAAKERA